jgi:hypothetical protein
MLQVFTDVDRFRVFQVRDLLENNGIKCSIKNEFSIGAMGELSPMDVLPEVWIHDSQWLAKTQQLIADFEEPVHASAWTCNQCNEPNEPSFELCWQCGTNRP